MTESAWQALVVLICVAVVAEGLLILGAYRELGAIILQIGPARYGEVGEGPAHGTVVTPALFPAGAPGLVVFVSPDCEVCQPIAAALPIVHRSYPELQILAAVLGQDEDGRETYARSLAIDARTDLQSLSEDWGIPGTPFAVGIGTAGAVLASGIVNSMPQLEMLAETVAEAARTVHNHGSSEGGPDASHEEGSNGRVEIPLTLGRFGK